MVALIKVETLGREIVTAVEIRQMAAASQVMRFVTDFGQHVAHGVDVRFFPGMAGTHQGYLIIGETKALGAAVTDKRNGLERLERRTGKCHGGRVASVGQ
ncbi:hypothetical protein D3C81_2100620 [compost metagenome]